MWSSQEMASKMLR